MTSVDGWRPRNRRTCGAAAACQAWCAPVAALWQDWQAICAAWSASVMIPQDRRVSDRYAHWRGAVRFQELEIAFDGSSHRQWTCDAIGRLRTEHHTRASLVLRLRET